MTEVLNAGEEFNSLQLVSIAKKAIGGRVIAIRPYEKCLTIRIEDDKVNLLFETFLVREQRTRTVFLKQGKRLVSYDRATGVKLSEMTMWDEVEPEVAELVNFGRTHTESEVRERIAFERDCYRPGTDRHPLDNYSRVQAGATAPKMERHW